MKNSRYSEAKIVSILGRNEPREKVRDPYSSDVLSRLDTLTQEVERYPGVQGVLSLTNVPRLVRQGDSLVTRPLALCA